MAKQYHSYGGGSCVMVLRFHPVKARLLWFKGINVWFGCAVHISSSSWFHRIRKAKAENVGVINVDGTYLERKRQKLLSSNINVAPLPYHPFHLRVGKLLKTAMLYILQSSCQVCHTRNCTPTWLKEWEIQRVHRPSELWREDMFIGHLAVWRSWKFRHAIQASHLFTAQWYHQCDQVPVLWSYF